MGKWAVRIEGYEYETDIDELRQWVVEGRVLPEDMVFRQGLGWKRRSASIKRSLYRTKKETTLAE